MHPTEAAGLFARARARWGQIQTEQPKLRPAVELQRRLMEAQIALLFDPDLSRQNWALPAPSAVAAALEADVPVMEVLEMVMPAAVLRALQPFAAAAAEGGAGEAGRKIGRALDSGALDGRAIARASFERDEYTVQTLAAEHGLNVQVLWFIAGVATAPLAHRVQMALLGPEERSAAVRGALERFDAGSCPACGSWPAVAEFVSGERLLRCDYCSCAWLPPTRRCVYCGNADERFKTIVPDRAAPGRRLELCGSCGGYLKTLDVAVLTPFPMLAIEDLASNDLDRMAMHHGLRRMPRRDRVSGS